MKTYVHTKTDIQMSIAVLFIIAKKWKTSKCPPTGECIKTMLSIHIMEYYSAKNRNGILMLVQCDNKNIMGRERSQTQRTNTEQFHL
jgi:hypothetical protein